jgi:hypothetical protein
MGFQFIDSMVSLLTDTELDTIQAFHMREAYTAAHGVKARAKVPEIGRASLQLTWTDQRIDFRFPTDGSRRSRATAGRCLLPVDRSARYSDYTLTHGITLSS